LLLSLSWKYFLLVFIAVLGVLQGAAARNNLRGLQFFGYRSISYVFAVLAVGFSLFFFFHWNYRYAHSVIEGAQQVGLFTLGGLAALVFTLGISSAIRSAYARRQVVSPRRLETRQVVRLRRLEPVHRSTLSKIIGNRMNGRH
jgi:hypothetical protein